MGALERRKIDKSRGKDNSEWSQAKSAFAFTVTLRTVFSLN